MALAIAEAPQASSPAGPGGPHLTVLREPYKPSPENSEGFFISEDFQPATLPDLIHGVVEVGEGTTKYTFQPAAEINPLPGITVGIIPGFGGKKFTSRALRNAFADKGVGSFTYDPIRKDGKGWREHWNDPQLAHEETISAIVIDLANHVEINFTDTEPIDNHPTETDTEVVKNKLLLLPHSMGGPAAARYAENRQQTVDSVFFLQCIGFGSPTIPQLARNVPRKLIGSFKNEFLPFLRSGNIDIDPRYMLGVLDYYFSVPTRTAGEIRSCLTENIMDLVVSLGHAGIQTAYADGEHDILVAVTDEATDGVVHLRQKIKGVGHLGPQAKPDRIVSWVIDSHKELRRLAN